MLNEIRLLGMSVTNPKRFEGLVTVFLCSKKRTRASCRSLFYFFAGYKRTCSRSGLCHDCPFNLSKTLPELKNELTPIIEDQMPHGSPAFISRARKALKELRQIDPTFKI